MHRLILSLPKENTGVVRTVSDYINHDCILICKMKRSYQVPQGLNREEKMEKLIRIFFSFPMGCQRQKILPNQQRDLSHSILVREEWLFSPFYNNN